MIIKLVMAFVALTPLLSFNAFAEMTVRSEFQECPRLTCAENLDYTYKLGLVGEFPDLEDTVCFMHSGTNPVEWIKFAPCPEGYTCNLPDNYAWINATLQFDMSSQKLSRSSTYMRTTEARCKKNEDFR